MLGTTRIRLKLFIEEVEVPITSISMSTSAQLSASITALATKESLLVKSGSNVIVAYEDPETFKAQGKKSGEYDGYFVLFMGQVADVTLQRQASNRTLSLSCIGHRAALNRAYLNIFDTNGDITQTNSRFVGAESFFTEVSGGLSFPNKIKKLFSGDHKIYTPGFNTFTGPVRGVIALIERALGYSPKGNGVQVPAQTNYLAMENENKKILNQIGAVDTDNFVEAVIGNSQFTEAISGASSKVTGTQTLLSLIKVILAQFYYEFIPIGAPVLKVVDIQRTELLDVYNSVIEAHSVHSVSYDSLLKSESQIFKGGFIKAKSVAEMRDYLIRMEKRGFDFSPEKDLPGILSDKFISRKFYRSSEKYQKIEIARILHDRLVTRLIVDSSTEVGSNEFLKTLNANIRDAILSICAVFVSEIRRTEPPKVDQIINYLLVPNLFFAVPPACNTLFPNQVYSYNTVASRYSNPTRLMLQVEQTPSSSSQEGPTQSGKTTNITYARYYAPSIEAFATIQGKAKLTKDQNLNMLLPHEENTGVVPVFKQTNFITRLKGGLGFSGDKKDDHELYMRLANFELMTSRYEKNVMSVSGPFNPFAVAGFPCTIIDTDSVPGDSTLYTGLLSSLSHSVSTNNASTSYTVTHVRPLGEVDSIFKTATFYREGSNKKKSPLHSSNASDPVVSIIIDISDQQVLDLIAFRLFDLAAMGLDTYRRAQNSMISSKADTSLLSTYSNRKLVSHNKESIATSKGNIDLSFSTPQLIGDIESLYPNTFKPGSVKAVDLGLNIKPEDNYVGSAFSQEEILFEGTANMITSYFRVKDLLGKKDFEEVINEIETELRAGRGKEYTRYYIPEDTFALKDKITNLINNPDNFVNGHQIAVYVQRSDLLTGSEALSETPLASEEWFRPYWWGEAFRADNIGEQVYYKLLGSGSVQDTLPSDVPKDAVVMDGDIEIPIVSTRSAISYSHELYDSLNSARSREAFVRTHINRGLVSINELFELYEERYSSRPSVVQTKDQCGFGKVKVLDTRGVPSEVDPKLIKLNREAEVRKYKNSLNRKAFK